MRHDPSPCRGWLPRGTCAEADSSACDGRGIESKAAPQWCQYRTQLACRRQTATGISRKRAWGISMKGQEISASGEGLRAVVLRNRKNGKGRAGERVAPKNPFFTGVLRYSTT